MEEKSKSGYPIDFYQKEFLVKLAEDAKKYGFTYEHGVLEVPEYQEALYLLKLKLDIGGGYNIEHHFYKAEQLRYFLNGVFLVCNVEKDSEFTHINNFLKE